MLSIFIFTINPSIAALMSQSIINIDRSVYCYITSIETPQHVITNSIYTVQQYIFLLYVLHVVDWSVGPCLNRPESSNLNNLTNSEAAVWIKITSSWMGLLVYIWTLIAPVLFPDRDFDWSDHTFLMEPIEQNNIPYQCLHVLVRIHKSYC